jgi:hypothetical protein
VRGRTVAVSTVLLLLLPAAAGADETCDTLSQAILDAPVGATVTLQEGEICSGLFSIGKRLTLQGGGTGATFKPGSDRSLFWFDAGNSTLRNLTFAGTGGPDSGGVSFSQDSTPTIDHVTFVDNDFDPPLYGGGGLSIISTSTSGTITLTGVTVGLPGHGNRALNLSGGGATIRAPNGPSVLIENSTFRDNIAGHEGGNLYVRADLGDITVRDSSLIDGRAGPSNAGLGGGAYLSGLTVHLLRNQIVSNEIRLTAGPGAQALGAGAYVLVGEAAGAASTLTGNVFDQNEVVAVGGGEVNVAGGGAHINGRTTLLGNAWTANKLPLHAVGSASGSAFRLAGACGAGTNTATVGQEYLFGNTIAGPGELGAAIDLQRCTGTFAVDIDDATVRGNTTGGGASAINASGATALSIDNSVFWDNTGGTAEIVSLGTVAVRHSDVCTGGAAYSGTGNICADPLFASGSSAGVAAGSPVIDAGSNDLIPPAVLAFVPAAQRILDGSGDCTAIVDMGVAERASACPPPSTPAPTPTPTPTPMPTPAPTPTPAVVVEPVINPGQILLCEGHQVVLIDVHREGKEQVIRGVALTTLAGKKVKIVGDHGGGSYSAKVAKDGSFGIRVPAPKSDATSYVGSYGGSKSSPLKVTRNLTVISTRKVPGGLRVVARHSKGKRVAGERATVLRQSGCNDQKRSGTATFDKRGVLTVVLAAPRPPDTVAVYRITTRTNNTFSLPIVVRR